MKVLKDLLSSCLLHVYKLSASCRKPFRLLIGETSKGQKFFSRVLTDQKFQDTFRQNGKEYIQVYISNESIWLRATPFWCLDR